MKVAYLERKQQPPLNVWNRNNVAQDLLRAFRFMPPLVWSYAGSDHPSRTSCNVDRNIVLSPRQIPNATYPTDSSSTFSGQLRTHILPRRSTLLN